MGGTRPTDVIRQNPNELTLPALNPSRADQFVCLEAAVFDLRQSKVRFLLAFRQCSTKYSVEAQTIDKRT